MRMISVSLFLPTVVRNGKKTKSKVWNLAWRDPTTGKRRTETTGTRNKKLAQRKAREKEDQLYREAQGWYDPCAEHVDKSWADAKQEFLEHKQERVRPDTTRTYRDCLRVFERFKRPRLLREIDQAFVEQFATERLKQGVEPSTVNKDLRCIRSLLNWAEESHYLRKAPRVKELSVDTGEPVVVPKENIHKVFESLDRSGVTRRSPGWWRVFLQIALYTGSRRSEILGLRWKYVDFDSGTVRIERSTSKGRRDRTYESAFELTAVLEKWWKSLGEPAPDTAVLPWPYPTRRQLYPDWAKIIRAAGVEYFVPHNCRSTVTSELLEEHNSMVVKDWVGHASIRTTERYYANTGKARRQLAERRKVVE